MVIVVAVVVIVVVVVLVVVVIVILVAGIVLVLRLPREVMVILNEFSCLEGLIYCVPLMQAFHISTQ